MAKVHWTTLDRMVKHWADDYGVEEAEGKVCIKRLWGEECPEGILEGRNAICRIHQPPACEHPSLWMAPESGDLHFVSLPTALAYNEMDELVAFCREHYLSWIIKPLIDPYSLDCCLLLDFWQGKRPQNETQLVTEGKLVLLREKQAARRQRR